MPKEYSITTVSTGWKLPFNLAILFHVLLLSSAIILPKYIHTRPEFPEFTSVDLINIAETLPAKQTSAPQSTPVKLSKPPVTETQKVTTLKAKKLAPIAPVLEQTPQASVAKAISIKPLKRKLKKKLPTIDKSAQERQKKLEAAQNRKLIDRQKALEAESRQLQDEANRQQAIADAEAKIAASAALNALKESLRADEASASSRIEHSNNRRYGGTSSALAAQYQSSIGGHLDQYWAFPVNKQEGQGLSATVIIKIAKDGRIINYHFEKYSGDRVFDQFVNRTLQEANPLPAIPRALKKQQYSIGLIFKPGKIQ